MNYTPAPWEIEKCPCGHPACEDYLVPKPTKSDGRFKKEDAQLISAAPELYEVLRELYDEYNDAPLLRRENEWQKFMEKARKALAKIEGRN